MVSDDVRSTPASPSRKFTAPVLALVAVIAGGVGLAVGYSLQPAGPDLTQMVTLSEYQDKAVEVSEKQAEIEQLEVKLATAQKVVQAESPLDSQTVVPIGTWVVGEDMPPGDYKLAEPPFGDCSYALYRSGTNQDDVVVLEFVEGGRPKVTVREGLDFESDCGDWVQVG